MKKVICAIFILLFLLPLGATEIGNYDFTFFKTMAPTTAKMTKYNFGFDYTGYGYIGDEYQTSGVYLRLGLEMPYTMFANLKDPFVKMFSFDSAISDYIQSRMVNNSSNKEDGTTHYNLMVALGPSYRKYISSSCMWYMGIGPSVKTDTRTDFDQQSDTHTTVNVSEFGLDSDMGFRFTLVNHVSFRIGFHTYYDIIDLTITTFKTGNSDQTEQQFIPSPNILLTGEEHKSIQAIGYVSLGHSYGDRDNRQKYQYENSTKILGNGQITSL